MILSWDSSEGEIVAPLLSTMSYQDDLSQLMPSLYSKVKLAYGSDSTADLAQYANNHALPASSALLISPAAEQNCQPYGPTGAEQLPLQPVLNMKPRVQQGLSQRHKGTGRTVAHRAFDLMLRYDCNPYRVCSLARCDISSLQTYVSLAGSQ